MTGMDKNFGDGEDVGRGAMSHGNLTEVQAGLEPVDPLAVFCQTQRVISRTSFTCISGYIKREFSGVSCGPRSPR